MISVSGLSKSFGAQMLFTDVTFRLNPGERYGLVGANGSGKTTLLNILIGVEQPTDGSVSIAKRLKLGTLQQDQFLYENEEILGVTMMGNRELWDAIVEKDEVLANAESDFDGDRYAELEDIIVRHDGYSAEARAAEILEGLGLPTACHRDPLSTLSGGFKLRVLLAQVLAGAPDILLLDEPTNHLDIVSIRWLEKFLQNFAGPVVVISHDHRFLDNVSTNILDVDYQTVTLYSGNYTVFLGAKQDERDRKEKEIGKREKEIAHHRAFVDRFRAKASKARQAQSRVRMIEKKAESLETLPPSSRRYPTFRFSQVRPSGRETLKIKGIAKAFGDNEVLRGVDLTVRRGDRLAIMGPNGIGKSTLLKIIVGDLAGDSGEVEWGYETYPGYFAQDHREQLEPEDQTAEAAIHDACPGETTGSVRAQLGLVLFSGDEAKKRLGSLSGGEAARLVFCRLAVQQPNVLVLDEPTNHLDLESIEALVEGLRSYEGTLIFVSHDRWFVAQLATRIVEIKPDAILDYQGSYDEYVHYCGDDHLDVDTVVLKARRKKRKGKGKSKGGEHNDGQRPSPEVKKKLRQLTSRRDQIAAAVDRAEARVDEIDELFCDPAYFDRSRPLVRKVEAEQKQLRVKVEELMAEWETTEAELDSLG
ncbi:MAG TPA: ABC-F family ATP-binding cassette domain-containing protein [Acidobacteriota bacterium]|nr:ABC-F family ATP-binding cassette domain-containing protein [Acidobacteriota bacterium]